MLVTTHNLNCLCGKITWQKEWTTAQGTVFCWIMQVFIYAALFYPLSLQLRMYLFHEIWELVPPTRSFWSGQLRANLFRRSISRPIHFRLLFCFSSLLFVRVRRLAWFKKRQCPRPEVAAVACRRFPGFLSLGCSLSCCAHFHRAARRVDGCGTGWHCEALHHRHGQCEVRSVSSRGRLHHHDKFWSNKPLQNQKNQTCNLFQNYSKTLT